MAQTNIELHSTHRASPLSGFHGTFIVFFVVFLVLALVSMACLQNWRTWLPGAEGANSMLDGVKSAVYTVISQLA
jgi:succinate dehydrogenase/fumarate reductase cytochrome b subunit